MAFKNKTVAGAVEGSPAEEAAESPRKEAIEQAQQSDHPVTHRPHSAPIGDAAYKR